VRVPSSDSTTGFTSAPSAVESARFSRTVRRYALGAGDAGALVDAILAEAPDLAIVRFPASRPEVLGRLRETGSEVILGDCLVVWRRDNERAGPPDGGRQAGFSVREAVAADFPLLDRLTDEIFADYRNHYAANPRLAGFDLREGYREWTRGHVGTGERRCLLAAVEGVPCAYGTVRLDAEESEIVLNGVLPAYRGRGVYRDLLRAMVDLFVRHGSRRSMISTQVDNAAVQRVWVREGFFPSDAFLTVHLNRAG
jgi:GNAT superfamily N-acetyltransferase